MKPLYTGIVVSPAQGAFERLSANLSGLVDLVKESISPEQAYQELKQTPCDTAFIDISHDRSNGMKWIRRMKKQYPEIRLFILDQEPPPEIILEGFRSGALDFLSLVDDDSGQNAFNDKVTSALNRDGGGLPQGEMITLFSLKGGVGLTTTAINLAERVFSMTEEKVLLVDLNLFMGDVSGFLDIKPDFTPYSLISDIDRMDRELLFSSLFRHEKGFYVLAPAEEINDSDSISARDIAAMLDLLKAEFDYIVVDTPHDFSRRTLALLEHTDHLIVMVQQTLPSVKSTQRIIEFLDDIRFEQNKTTIVINRYLKTGDLTRKDIENSLNRKISYCINNDYGVCLKALNRGATLAQAAGSGKLVRQIEDMACHITGTVKMKPAGWKKLLARARI